jgi:hypothetical protein
MPKANAAAPALLVVVEAKWYDESVPTSDGVETTGR